MRRFAIAVSLGLVLVAFVRCGGSEAPVPSPTATTDSGATSSGTATSSSSSAGGATSSSSSSSGATSSSSSSSSSGTVEACDPKCGQGRECCGGKCVNTGNDPQNCGGCGTACKGETPYCDGKCTKAPCEGGGNNCDVGTTCCGNQCCKAGQICCRSDGPVSGFATCFTPTDEQKTCPQGCAPLCVSDRDKKHDFAPVNPRDVLDSVSRLPMSTWSYKDDPRGTRHLGPMAQDFKAELKLGGTDRAYESLDAHGVALTSIQALYQMVQEQNARITALEEENRKLRERER